MTVYYLKELTISYETVKHWQMTKICSHDQIITKAVSNMYSISRDRKCQHQGDDKGN